MQRIDFATVSPAGYKAMIALELYVASSSIEKKLFHLVKLRASQINGCAFCIDMHWKDLRVLGESEQRLYGLDAWEESPYYTQRERAAMAWTEAVTNLHTGHVPDAVYEHVRQQFPEKELADLTLIITTINAWNRLGITSRMEPGALDAAYGLNKANLE